MNKHAIVGISIPTRKQTSGYMWNLDVVSSGHAVVQHLGAVISLRELRGGAPAEGPRVGPVLTLARGSSLSSSSRAELLVLRSTKELSVAYTFLLAPPT